MAFFKVLRDLERSRLRIFFSKMVDVDRFQPSQLTELLALPDAEETEKFIAEKADEGQEIGKLVLLAEARLGELFNQMPKATKGTGANQYQDKSAKIPSARKFSTSESESEEDDEEEEPPLKPKLEYPNSSSREIGY